MVSQSRRKTVLSLCAVVVFIYFLFFNGDYGTTDFRATTENAIARKHGVLRGELSDEDLQAQTNAKLQEILDSKQDGGKPLEQQGRFIMRGGRPVDLEEERRKKDGIDPGATVGSGGTVNTQGGRVILRGGRPVNLDEEERIKAAAGGDEVSVGGRKTMPKQGTKSPEIPELKERPKYPLEKSITGDKADDGEEVALKGNKEESASDPGEDMAQEELQSILRKSPIVIFSKSYCPYSQRAKVLLLKTYTITPAPYVVELDQMTTKVPKTKKPSNDDEDDSPAPTLGRKLQDLLATLTGRRTVPNIMINSESLGGSDDIARMDADGTLIDNIKKMGGKRIVSIEKKEDADD